MKYAKITCRSNTNSNFPALEGVLSGRSSMAADATGETTKKLISVMRRDVYVVSPYRLSHAYMQRFNYHHNSES